MQQDFLYEPICNAAGCQLTVTVLADRDYLREEMCADASSAGFRVLDSCSLEEYAQGPCPSGHFHNDGGARQRLWMSFDVRSTDSR